MTSKKALIFIADGTEEMEYTITYDVLGEYMAICGQRIRRARRARELTWPYI